MFNRVGAFLEAIDKRTEELADAAEEEDRARADAVHQQQQQHHPHSRSSTPGSGPALTSSSYLSPAPFSHGVGTGRSASNAADVHAAGRRRSSGATPVPGGGAGEGSGAASAHPGPSAGAGGPAMQHALGGYAGVHVPLSLPTKLPSFRPGPHDGAASAHETGSSSSGGIDGAAGSAARPRTATGSGGPRTASLSVLAALSTDATAAAGGAATAVERLEARCRALEADKTRFQQEAATQRAQCTAARDALWTAEQEARAGRAAQRAAEQALAAYRETSQRLLDEAQRDMKRMREAADPSASASAAAAQAATADAVHSAQQLHQRLELLQADHAALTSEVERSRQEAAKAAAELQRVQEAQRESQARVDALQLDLDAARESLDGEAAAHAETRAALRQLQAQRDDLLPHRSHGAAGSSPNRHGASDTVPASSSAPEATTGWTDADVAQLQAEVRELRQRYQMASLQASNRQAALDAAAREAADMKMRYNELAKQVRDAEVEVAAGFNAAAVYGSVAPSPSSLSGFPAPPASLAAASVTGHRAFASGSGAGGAAPAAAAATAEHGAHAGNSGEALRRHPTMQRLGRQYGLAGRALVASVCAVDGTAVQLGRWLTQARWTWRVALMGYIGLLQVWVILMMIGTLALEENTAPAEMIGGIGA